MPHRPTLKALWLIGSVPCFRLWTWQLISGQLQQWQISIVFSMSSSSCTGNMYVSSSRSRQSQGKKADYLQKLEVLFRALDEEISPREKVTKCVLTPLTAHSLCMSLAACRRETGQFQKRNSSPSLKIQRWPGARAELDANETNKWCPRECILEHFKSGSFGCR